MDISNAHYHSHMFLTLPTSLMFITRQNNRVNLMVTLIYIGIQTVWKSKTTEYIKILHAALFQVRKSVTWEMNSYSVYIIICSVHSIILAAFQAKRQGTWQEPFMWVLLWVGHLGQKTSVVAGSVWMYLRRDTVWIFPELWLGNGSQDFMGNTEWKHVWCH